METRNKSQLSPQWVFSESMRDPVSLHTLMRVAIRSDDGWVKVLDLTTDGWNQVMLPTKRQILQNIQHNITLQLAELTLEET